MKWTQAELVFFCLHEQNTILKLKFNTVVAFFLVVSSSAIKCSSISLRSEFFFTYFLPKCAQFF